MPRISIVAAFILAAGCGNGNGQGEDADYAITLTDHEEALTPYSGDLLCWLELTRAAEPLEPDDLVLTASQPLGDTVTLLLEAEEDVLTEGSRAAVREPGTDEFDARTVSRSIIVGLSIRDDRGLREVANGIWVPEN